MLYAQSFSPPSQLLSPNQTETMPAGIVFCWRMPCRQTAGRG